MTKGGRLPYLEKASRVLRAEALAVPPEIPHTAETRSDLLNDFGAMMAGREEVMRVLTVLEREGELNNTEVIDTPDNSPQMPRALAHCDNAGPECLRDALGQAPRRRPP